jgi:hypothetical protein
VGSAGSSVASTTSAIPWGVDAEFTLPVAVVVGGAQRGTVEGANAAGISGPYRTVRYASASASSSRAVTPSLANAA